MPQATTPTVHFHSQTLLWPLRLLTPAGHPGMPQRRPWQCLDGAGADCPWQPFTERFGPQGEGFAERHYHEFVTFLPYVQRFLYGGAGEQAALRLYRRHDVAALRVQLAPGQAPITLKVDHIELFFFFDVDLIFLKVALQGQGLTLAQSQELMYRLGRGYPSGWDAQGNAVHAPAQVEWLGAQDQVLTRSDAQQQQPFLAQVARQRMPRVAADWAWLLQPLVADGSAEAPPQAWRYRQIEYYRMPLMAWLALDDPRALSRADFVRLGLVTGAAGPDAALPFAEAHLADFEARHCIDRFWLDGGGAPRTRYLASGHALVVVGDAHAPFFTCAERGVLAQFRHEHFLLFLIAHFQKAALLMFADRLAESLRALDVQDAESVRRFKRSIRANFEGFLRFTHRYWFHEVAEQAHARDLFARTARQLESEALYAEVKERIRDMSDYLDADSIRRQANTVVRLTVVTILGMVGTTTTGFLGMNLLDEAGAPGWQKLLWFAAIGGGSLALTLYTMSKSKRLSDFLDVLSDERLRWWDKLRALAGVWR
ncbi:hypothetical protein [Ideonella livida]|uniref:CorA-like Mg2+ transporter protein n=1 Tax=Ideonella livida TaxID=2707176 RepID=A0A7C9TNA6_9BURK|nr:hypothetical protein [Ideonella livida]NDY93305.1 hypothetical protein [Ideonella livida]